MVGFPQQPWGFPTKNDHFEVFWGYISLVGGFNPSEKYARQIGNLPSIGVKIKDISNHHPVAGRDLW